MSLYTYCPNCGQKCKKKNFYENHYSLCKIISNFKPNENDKEEDEIIPSNKMLFKAVQHFTKKCDKLESELHELKKSVIIKKDKTNILEWLNKNNTIPEFTLKELPEQFIVSERHINTGIKKDIYAIINEILRENINLQPFPLYCTTEKQQHIFYGFISQEQQEQKKEWILLENDTLIRCFNSIQKKIINALQEWKKNNKNNADTDTQYNSLLIKLFVSFKDPVVLNKTKNVLFTFIKSIQMDN
jgi:hypothetical protein